MKKREKGILLGLGLLTLVGIGIAIWKGKKPGRGPEALAWDQGWAAGWSDSMSMDLSDNPYTDDPEAPIELQQAWDQGWDKGFADREIGDTAGKGSNPFK